MYKQRGIKINSTVRVSLMHASKSSTNVPKNQLERKHQSCSRKFEDVTQKCSETLEKRW